MNRQAGTVAPDPGAYNTIEVHVRDLAQLFDSLDPYPFHERDLDASAEAYILASLRELQGNRPCALIVYLDVPAESAGAATGQAVQAHFARRAQLQRRELRSLMRKGWISLAIGLSFLALLLFASEIATMFLGEGPFARIVSESLVIGGWVAMWKPLEIFLYDWWPMLGAAKELETLAAAPVHFEDARNVPPGTVPRPKDVAPLRTA